VLTKLSDEAGVTFSGTIGLLELKVFFGPWDSDGYVVSLFLVVPELLDFMQQSELFLDELNLGSSLPILVVDLIWLCCNENLLYVEPDCYPYKDAAIFLRDFDEVGLKFFCEFDGLEKLANFVRNIDKYPARIKRGGALASKNRFIYSAALYYLLGMLDQADSAIKAGFAELNSQDMSLVWVSRKVEEYTDAANKLKELIEKSRSQGHGPSTP
jgi:hypothetical protein